MKMMLTLLLAMGCLVSTPVTSILGEEKKEDDRIDTNLKLYSGEITEIEHVANAITVLKIPVRKRFLVAVTCKITTSDKPNATLKDLKVGDKVKVRYEQAQDGLIARRIIIRGIDADDREEAREREKLDRR